jgi:hypothetical protein
LTHQQLIDQSWESTIVPLLLSNFPSLSPEELRKAHAFAYGGSVIQDLGYYPFSNAFFSNLTHYVRSGDFVRSLFRNAQTADELAFAIGALSHYVGDSIGHSFATNPSVGITFPKLSKKYGPSVNYAQGKNAHGQVEFAFDINQATKRHLAPYDYVTHIGLNVPWNQLAAAFEETYGFPMNEIIGEHSEALRSYRFGARRFLPSLTYAEGLLHKDGFPDDTPGPEVDVFERHTVQLAREADWDSYRKNPGAGIHVLAGLIVIIPKIGPAKMLAIKGPTMQTESLYIESVNLSAAALAAALKQLAMPSAGSSAHVALPESLVPDRDLDTGKRVVPGGYVLTDQTYAKLLARITKDATQLVPEGLKKDILSYYVDPNAPISTKHDTKKWALVQEQLRVLADMPVKADPIPLE